MVRSQISFRFSFVLLGFSIAIASCNYTARKNAVQDQSKKDSAKPVIKAETMKGAFPTFVVLDTVVGTDTIKFTMYSDSLVRCSVNRLCDSCNCGGRFEHWDSSFGDYGLIMVPDKKKLQKFILNDSILIVPVSFGFMRMNGGVALFLINRTKHSLKFADANKHNPIRTGSSNAYIDLKNNQIINYYYTPEYDNVDAGECNLDHPRYLVYRYKIAAVKSIPGGQRHFIQTDEVAASSKELDKVEVFIGEDSIDRVFYTWLVRKENWKRDKYDSTIYQKVILLDTMTAKNKIQVYYDNRGWIIATFNKTTDTFDWGEKWIGYEWWRGNEDNKIIVPGGKRPVSYILNDTMLVISLCDIYRYTSLFVLRRYADSLVFIDDQLSTTTDYLYVDLKNNSVLEQAGRLSDGCRLNYEDDYSRTIPFTVNRYKIEADSFLQTDSVKLLSKELNNIDDPDSYKGSKSFYNSVLHSNKLKQNNHNHSY